MKSIWSGLQTVAPKSGITINFESQNMGETVFIFWGFTAPVLLLLLPWRKEVKWDEYVSVISNFK